MYQLQLVRMSSSLTLQLAMYNPLILNTESTSVVEEDQGKYYLRSPNANSLWFGAVVYIDLQKLRKMTRKQHFDFEVFRTIASNHFNLKNSSLRLGIVRWPFHSPSLYQLQLIFSLDLSSYLQCSTRPKSGPER